MGILVPWYVLHFPSLHPRSSAFVTPVVQEIVLPSSFHLQDLIEATATAPSSPCAPAPCTDVWKTLQPFGIPFKLRRSIPQFIHINVDLGPRRPFCFSRGIEIPDDFDFNLSCVNESSAKLCNPWTDIFSWPGSSFDDFVRSLPPFIHDLVLIGYVFIRHTEETAVLRLSSLLRVIPMQSSSSKLLATFDKFGAGTRTHGCATSDPQTNPSTVPGLPSLASLLCMTRWLASIIH